MALSALDLFSIGIGPSSSHTVGPMRAARSFIQALEKEQMIDAVDRLHAELFGSLGATGRGHGSDKAIILGFMGEDPESVETLTADRAVDQATEAKKIMLAGRRMISFNRANDVVLHLRQSLPAHPNGMRFQAFDGQGNVLAERVYYSVGGGFVVDEDAVGKVEPDTVELPYPFSNAGELLAHCAKDGLSISDIMLANEGVWRSEQETRSELLHIWETMKECVSRGCSRTEAHLPGNLMVRRRAPRLLADLQAKDDASDPLRALDWVNLFALAVNEENATGGRVVTAPTNGAAGIIPAVLHYYMKFIPGANEEAVVRFLLTAAAIGVLFKKNASISGAEVGCQGEVGSACSMAAGALCEILGGTPEQVENAAEIGIEHNLGLTCDPVGGLVQIPCIERNAVASNKAINAARISLRGDGTHHVSLDTAIKTMRETGADMKSKYKETSRGGLAVNVIAC
ncbi:L-serine ammonia-lyase [Paenarthrobacter aurescens]|uniref:L-serine dehydratase n=1 Tax=Paenarthrobacter aurescens TaxID=43663 RepID=A0A4Y3N9B6_PAEAU|nr:L-serine ammonia-lyase [Paenarthrobacter aurescens]MDO6143404.1 L-serine ammonia-lyase [Paenarthrobacter aurescens]MDO6147252.1 L-serine ammonia-lyase [Paenarthrobacter aurescens]MDO6158496.1 L-serine ammonia-lyase [Paenarthrobacter aurescens]MDO6162479.1 L-serine ammonia-lyase [Paenarthrobacter aurescens]GEB18222.1 L-serine dehydratase [Paenarthrobacter aurescens]